MSNKPCTHNTLFIRYLCIYVYDLHNLSRITSFTQYNIYLRRKPIIAGGGGLWTYRK